MAKSFETHARTVTLLTLVSRVTGFMRDALLTRVFGAGPLMDAFNFGFQVPNLFRRLFGEGALTASFLPVYARLDRDDPARAKAFAGVVVALLCVLLSVITLAGEGILALLPESGAESGIGVRLLMIMLPYMPLVCLTALLGAILQVHHRFGPTAASPILLNLAVAGSAFWGSYYSERIGIGHVDPARHIHVVAVSVLVAGVLQVAWSVFALRGHGVKLGVRVGDLAPHLRETVVKALPMLLGLGVFQINTAVDSLIASWRTMVGETILGVPWPLPEGSMTFLSCGQRLYEFPLGVFGVSIATAIFPALSRLANDADAFLSTLRRGLRLTVFIGLPASVGLILIRTPLAATLFQGGRFTAADSEMVGFVLMGYAPAIWAYSLQQVVTRAFYAKGDSVTPVRVAMAMVALNFLLNVTLIWTPLGVAGLAWSTAIAAMVQIAIMLRILSKRIGSVVDAGVRRAWIRTAGATAIMAAITIGALLLADLIPLEAATWLRAIVKLSIGTATGATAYIAVTHLMGMPELKLAIGRHGEPDAVARDPRS